MQLTCHHITRYTWFNTPEVSVFYNPRLKPTVNCIKTDLHPTIHSNLALKNRKGMIWGSPLNATSLVMQLTWEHITRYTPFGSPNELPLTASKQILTHPYPTTYWNLNLKNLSGIIWGRPSLVMQLTGQNITKNKTFYIKFHVLGLNFTPYEQMKRFGDLSI